MKRKNYFPFLVWLIGAAFILSLYFLLPGEREEEMPAISVIVNDSADSRWTRFQAGLEKAADDYHVALNYVLTEEFANLESEERLIRSESQNASAVIVQFVESSGTVDLINELCGRMVLCLVDTEAEAEAGENFASITANNRGIGTALADILKDDTEENESMRIGLLSGSDRMSSMKERREAFEAEAEAIGGEIKWTITRSEKLRDKLFSEPVDIVVALDNSALETAVDAFTSLRLSDVRLYGVGCSDRTIYYLDRGVIRAMVVPNDFQMGYLAVADAVGRISAPNIPMIHREISYDVITRSNIYDSRNETLLFPVIN